jgi:hypothetical protein
MARYRRQQRRRINRLEREGFSGLEARQLSTQVLSRPYMKRMRRDRRKGIQREGDWASVWQMFKYYYRRTIELGDYIPPPKRKRPGSVDKGDVVAQRQRYKEKQREKAPPVGKVVFDEKQGRFVPVFYERAENV